MSEVRPSSLGSERLHAALRSLIAIDYRTLALARALVAIALVSSALRRLGHLRAFYSDAGVVPRAYSAALDDGWRLSLHAANGQTLFGALLTLVSLIAATALLKGYRTRLATVVCFALQASLLSRDPLVLVWSDQLLTCILFFACFIPWGARWSADSALAPPQDHGTSCASIATAAVLIQVMLVFAISGIAGNHAAEDPLALAGWRGYVGPLGTWVAAHGVSAADALRASTFLATWCPVLAFLPMLLPATRPLAVLALALSVLAAFFCFNLGPIPFVTLAALSLFIGPGAWRLGSRLTSRNRGSVPLRVFYDREHPCSGEMCRLIAEYLVLTHAEVAPAQDNARAEALLRANKSWVVIDHDDHAYLKATALLVLLRRSPLFGWLGALLWWLPGIGRAGDAMYDRMREHQVRRRLSRAAAPLFEPSRAASTTIALVLALIITVNVTGLEQGPSHFGRALRAPLEVLRLDQSWRVLLPPAGGDASWLLLPGQLEDGAAVDVLHPDGPAVNFEAPLYISETLEPDLRWHVYRVRISNPQLASGRAFYARYLCRQWNQHRAAGKRLHRFKLINMISHQGSTPSGLEQHVLGEYDCFAGEDPP